MKYLRNLLLFFFVLLAFATCRKTEETPVIPDPQPKPYEQYGKPFRDIPKIQDVILYEVNLRAFSPAGNLQGVISRLENIKALGVNVVWLMPIYPAGKVNSVNSPYCIRDYKAVGAEYGSLADLRQLTDKAHSLGMAVMMDWVANHTSWDHPWIANKNWYTQDGNGNIIHPAGTNWQDVADLNYGSQEMRAAMTDAMQYWIYQANIDGYRCDYADGVPYDFWTKTLKTLRADTSRRLIFFAEGTRNDHFGAGFDLLFGWNFYGALKEVFKGQPASRLMTAHSSEYSATPAGKHWVRFTTNHDESAWDATPVVLFNGIDGALAASVITLFYGGVPLLYGSQEVGTVNNVPFFSNSAINWGGNPAMLSAYQTLFKFYAGSATAKVEENAVYPHSDVVCFKKNLAGEEILIIVNVRNAAVNYPLPEALKNTVWTDIMTEQTFSLQGSLAMQPYRFLVLRK
jgi:glycosidase